MSCMNDGLKDVSDFFSGIFTGEETKEIINGIDDTIPTTSTPSTKTKRVKKEKSTVVTTNEDEPEREKDIDKTSATCEESSSCKRSIEKAYFAKKTKVGKDAGSKIYKFRNKNTITNKNKNEIAGIIKNRVKNGKKYSTVKEILTVMSNKTYQAGESLTIPLLTAKEVLKKVEKTSIGSDIYLVAETKGYKKGESVTLKIYEKESMLVSANKELPFLKGKTQATKVMATVNTDHKATVKITLRPQIDKKVDDKSGKGSLEAWKEKFKKVNEDDDEKKDYLWLKVTSLVGDKEEKEFLQGSELELSMCNEVISKTLLQKAFKNASKEKIDEYHPVINKALCLYKHNNLKSIAYFLGQASAETADLKYKEEIATGSLYEGRKDLGNIKTGDGKKFKGRGMIQLTGRTNYAGFQKYARANIDGYSSLDITSSTDKAQQLVTILELNVLASLWYWTKGIKGKKIQKQISSDKTSIFWISVYVNGWAKQEDPYYENRDKEPNHMEKRVKRTEIAKKALGV